MTISQTPHSKRLIAPLRGALAALIAALSLIAVTQADRADAAVFCVNDPNCVGVQKSTVDQALTDAQSNGQTDTVHIGAKATPYADSNGFSYISNETVHIVGAGRDQTVLEATAFSHTLQVMSPTSTVSSMTLKVPDTSNGTGLRWDGTASNLDIRHDGTSQLVLGTVPEGAAVLEDSTIDVNGGYAVSGQNVSGAVIRDTSITSGTSGASWSGTSMNFSRVAITAPRSAISVLGNKTSSIDNSVLRMTAGGNAADGVVTAANGANVVVNHATIVGPGSKRGVIVGADSADASMTITSSIVTGFQNSLYRLGTGHQADLGIQYSSYDPTVSSSGDGTLTQGAGTITDVTPDFVNATFGNFRLRAKSPLLDAADPGSATTLDRAGKPRKVDGDGDGGARADIGAYEYQYQAPNAVLTGPDSVDLGAAADFSSVGSSDPDGESLTRTWSFGDGATAQGLSAGHAYAAAGAYTVTLTVTDPAGRSAVATKQVQVNAPPAPPAQPGGTGGSTGSTPQAGSTAGGQTALKLTGLRVLPGRVRLGRAAPRLVRGPTRASRIEFRLSRAGRVLLRFQRCAKLRGKRCARFAKTGEGIVVNGRAGRNVVRFAGRTSKRRALRPGAYRLTASATGTRITARFALIR